MTDNFFDIEKMHKENIEYMQVGAMTDTELTQEQKDIIKFVVDKERELSVKVQEDILLSVKEKYGEDGIKLYQDLISDDDFECPECAKDSETKVMGQQFNSEDIKQEDEWVNHCGDFYILDQELFASKRYQHKIYIGQITQLIATSKNKEIKDVTKEEIESVISYISFRAFMEGWITHILYTEVETESVYKGLETAFKEYIENQSKEIKSDAS